MAIKAVLFDLDETLIHEEASIEETFLVTCQYAYDQHGIDPKALSQSVRAHARTLWRSLPTHDYCISVGISCWEGLSARFLGDSPHLDELRALVPEYRRAAWQKALDDFGIHDPEFAERLNTTFAIERAKHHVAFPEAEPILKNLQEDYRLALITNGPSDLQREKLTVAKLEHYFELVVISGELGFGKPDPRIFQYALQRLQVAPHEAVMVGDSIERDIAGAKQTGIAAIWVNRSPSEQMKTVKPDAEIANLRNLVPVLKWLGR